MKQTRREDRQVVELGSAARATKGGAGDITDQSLRQPFGGLGIQ
jgi:hypothetical protein